MTSHTVTAALIDYLDEYENLVVVQCPLFLFQNYLISATLT